MKNYFLRLSLLLLFFSCNSIDNDRKNINVLFIGNSMTYFNGMPEILQQMLKSENLSFNIEQSTYPGMTLSSHLDNIIESSSDDGIKTRIKRSDELTETEKKISEKKWDIVVLQEGIVRLLIPEAKDSLVVPAILKIKRLVNNPDCEYFLFSTWPSKGEYPKQYCNTSSYWKNGTEEVEKSCSIQIENLEHEITLIRQAYLSIASANSLYLTDNVDRFYKIIKNHPEIDFYEDEIHPTKEGAYLNACIFYKYISGKNAASITYSSDLSKTTTDILKKVADQEI